MGELRCTRCGKPLGRRRNQCDCPKIPYGGEEHMRLGRLVVNVPPGCAMFYDERKE